MDGDKMQIDDANSSSASLSPPQSPEAPDANDASTTIHVHGGAASQPSPATHATAKNTATPPAPTKRRYRKRDSAPEAPPPPPVEEKPKEKKPRKPRAPRDPNAPAPTRRRTKAAEAAAAAAAAAAQAAAEAAAAETPPAASTPAPQSAPAAATPTPAPLPASSTPPAPEEKKPVPQPTAAPTRQPRITELVGVLHQEKSKSTPPPPISRSVEQNEHITTSNPTLSHLTAPIQSARPASSGQLYDPIRSATVEASSTYHVSNSAPVSPPPKVLNRASASPSINSLIDPPTTSNSVLSSSAQHVRLQQQQQQQQPQSMSVTSAPASPAPSTMKSTVSPATTTAQVDIAPSLPRSAPAVAPTPSMAMDIDPKQEEAPSVLSQPVPITAITATTNNTPTASATANIKKSDSAGATPPISSTPPTKPVRQKEAPPPLPTGSGLLAGTPFGLTAASNAAPSENGTNGTNIYLTFDLKGQNNVTINFAREVEKKYGFAALYPRIAAQRERRRQIAAAGAALDKAGVAGSADDMSLDLSEPESNPEMDIDAEGEASATDGAKKRKRKKRTEEYDKEDDFIDDTELAWEQQALMAQDGFFVYSGPLVPEGEKPSVERADGSSKRGRGRGRGGAARGETAARGNRGGGRGSRGGTTVRKPRVTKADRAMMEQEKMQRERLASTLAAKPAIQQYATGQVA